MDNDKFSEDGTEFELLPVENSHTCEDGLTCAACEFCDEYGAP
jgi:hypothetical protein